MAAKRVRINPELLIIANPGDGDAARAAVWRKLRRRYAPELAAASYCKIYPDAIRKVRRNKGGSLPFDEHNPKYRKALALFRKFHGIDSPDQVLELDIPELGDGEIFLVGLGRAPAESYLTDKAVKGSSKNGSIYVHPYEGTRPWKAVTSDGRTILTLPGKHRVKDWIYG